MLYCLFLEFNFLKTPVTYVFDAHWFDLLRNEYFAQTIGFFKFEFLANIINTYLNRPVVVEIADKFDYIFELQQQQTVISSNTYFLKNLLKNTLLNVFDVNTIIEVFFYDYTAIFYFNVFTIF